MMPCVVECVHLQGGVRPAQTRAIHHVESGRNQLGQGLWRQGTEAPAPEIDRAQGRCQMLCGQVMRRLPHAANAERSAVGKGHQPQEGWTQRATQLCSKANHGAGKEYPAVLHEDDWQVTCMHHADACGWAGSKLGRPKRSTGKVDDGVAWPHAAGSTGKLSQAVRTMGKEPSRFWWRDHSPSCPTWVFSDTCAKWGAGEKR